MLMNIDTLKETLRAYSASVLSSKESDKSLSSNLTLHYRDTLSTHEKWQLPAGFLLVLSGELVLQCATKLYILKAHDMML